MLRLAIPKEPYWLDLPAGVRLQVRPLTTAVMAAAQARAQQAVAELAEQVRARHEAGLPLDALALGERDADPPTTLPGGLPMSGGHIIQGGDEPRLPRDPLPRLDRCPVGSLDGTEGVGLGH
jgi:hypothetical protein